MRMEAAIATSYIGTEAAMHALADTTKHPHGGHLAYGMRTALGASTMLPHWQFNHHSPCTTSRCVIHQRLCQGRGALRRM